MIRSIDSNQPTKRNNARLMLTTAAGATLGAASRFVVPTKNELSSLKTASDSFFSNAKTAARGQNRSILKYAGIGAVVAAGIHTVAKLVNNKKAEKAEKTDTVEFSKYQAIIDAPDYACEILIYED